MMSQRFVTAALLAIAGCSQDVAETQKHESADARQVLMEVLDAWKAGHAKALASSNPPVRFVDDDYVAGWQLAEYDIELWDVEIRPYEDVKVNLTLRDPQGKTVKKTVAYQVSLAPGLAVLRSEP